ncbi:MAG TPA: hypothetical protein VJ717_17335 [Gemmatimonadaceae bacterium]|nr:hypothetical protein [Gemmatimonadaceae bacterium]
MTAPISPASKSAFELIEVEKRRDRLIRRVSIIAWSVTFAIVLLYALLTFAAFIEVFRGILDGNLPWMTAMGTATPLIQVLLLLSVLVAALSTIGVFLRFRSASLAEIQLRLAALEDILASRPDIPNEQKS